MARVNHLKLKQLVYANTGRYTDQEFFESKELTAYMQDILDIISCAYISKNIVRVRVIWEESEGFSIACTDNEVLILNAGHSLLKALSREERFECLLGLLLHETGHILFTNFRKVSEVSGQLSLGRLILVPDDRYEDAYRAYEKVRDYLLTVKNPQVKSIIIDIWKSLVNALEDGHIDIRVGERYPGYKPYLDFINDLCFDMAPTVSEVKAARKKLEAERPDEPVCLIYDFLQYLLSYSNYGFLKGEEWEIRKDEAAMKIYEVIDWIDLAKETNSSLERILYQTIVFYKAFPFEYVDALLLKYGNEEGSTVDEGSIKELQNALSQTNQIAAGISYSDKTHISSMMSGGSALPAGDESMKSPDNSSNGGTANQEIAADYSPTPSESEGAGESSDEGSQSNEMKVDELPNICSNSLMGEASKQKLEDALKDMEGILDKMKKNESLRAKEQYLEQELNTFAASIRHDSIHDGIKADVKRMDSPDEEMIKAYDKVWPELSPISKKLAGRLEKELEKKKKGYKQKNLYYGKRLEASTVIRGDGKYFSRKNLPSDKKRLAVGLLVDESGSMSMDNRIHHARMTSLILYDFCRKLDIPIAVYGHTTKGEKVLLHAYAEFDSIDRNDKFRIMQMNAGGTNRDGYALRFLAERLMTQHTEVKLLLIISDGKPNHYGYSSDNAFEDLSSIKREYRNKDVITIAAAIGDDKSTIEHIYGKEAFLDVTDLNELSRNLVSVIKEYL